jgi:hypothetical protein
MVVAVIATYRAGAGWLVVALVPVLAYGALVWQGGVALAARRVRGREPELLVALDIRNVT